jgi:hypothetical protein
MGRSGFRFFRHGYEDGIMRYLLRGVLGFLALAFVMITFPLKAEPLDRWWGGGGMGVAEYGYTASDGSKWILISCPYDGASILVSINGVDPAPSSTVTFEVSNRKIELYNNASDNLNTDSHVNADGFYLLSDLIRAGRELTVTLESGETAKFSLAGSSREMPKEPCVTGFAYF